MKYTSDIFRCLSRGQFISSNSINHDMRVYYADIEENFGEYCDYFSKIDFELSVGDGYYYFSRREPKVIMENKLAALFSWIDYVDFLKTYDTSFGPGSEFALSNIETRISSDPELREKLSMMFGKELNNRQKLETLAEKLVSIGFAEITDETESRYFVTSAFRYIEGIISCINIEEDVENEIPQ